MLESFNFIKPGVRPRWWCFLLAVTTEREMAALAGRLAFGC